MKNPMPPNAVKLYYGIYSASLWVRRNMRTLCFNSKQQLASEFVNSRYSHSLFVQVTTIPMPTYNNSSNPKLNFQLAKSISSKWI